MTSLGELGVEMIVLSFRVAGFLWLFFEYGKGGKLVNALATVSIQLKEGSKPAAWIEF